MMALAFGNTIVVCLVVTIEENTLHLASSWRNIAGDFERESRTSQAEAPGSFPFATALAGYREGPASLTPVTQLGHQSGSQS